MMRQRPLNMAPPPEVEEPIRQTVSDELNALATLIRKRTAQLRREHIADGDLETANAVMDAGYELADLVEARATEWHQPSGNGRVPDRRP